MEDLKIQELHAAFTKKLRPKRSKSFPKKEQYSSKTTEKIVNLENSSYVKNESNKNNAMTRKREQEHLAF
jgi:hypothetical protein